MVSCFMYLKLFKKAFVKTLREKEDRLDREYYEKMDEADRFQRAARELEAEADKLEWESL